MFLILLLVLNKRTFYESMETTTLSPRILPAPLNSMPLSVLRLYLLPVSQPPTPGLNSPMTEMEFSSQESEIFFPTSASKPLLSRKGGRLGKRAKYHGNRFTILSPNTSLDDCSYSLPRKPKSKRITYKIPRCGYTSRIFAPRLQKKVDVQLKTDTDTQMIKASRSIGMRLLDIGILGEALAKIRCTFCPTGYLSLFESEWLAN